MKKKTEINPIILKQKRQLNVHEQQILAKHQIKTTATYWRTHQLPIGLQQLFKEQQIDFSKCIMLDYQQDFPGVSTDEGLILTDTGVFIRFEVDLDSERSTVDKVYLWKDVSKDYILEKGKKGTGVTYAYLAMEVLRELNAIKF